MIDIKKPGYCEEPYIWKEDKRLFNRMAKFIGCYHSNVVADIGVSNIKIKVLEDKLNIVADHIIEDDFNNGIKSNCKYHTVFCFEVLEHLQNPMLFLKSIRDNLMFNTSNLYLSLPGRPKFLWTEHHFREYTPKALKKWLLDPLDLYIVRKKKLMIGGQPWWFYITGIRPIFRLFLNHTVIYEIKKK